MSPLAEHPAPTFPDDWGTTQLRYASTCLDGRRVPLNVDQRSRRQGEYPYWGANGVVDSIDEYIFDEPLVLIGEDGAPFFDSTRPVAFFVSGKIWVNNHIHVLRIGRHFDSRFVTHCLNATDYGPHIEGSTRDKLTQEKMGSIRLPSPPLPQQRAIADYLDSETARLDTLVAAKERVLRLLAEKRRALITSAVTCGLNPNTPLRESGIPWLGEIPAHWETRRLKFISPQITVGIVVTPAKYYEVTGVPCLRSLNVRERGLSDADLVFISEESNLLHSKSIIHIGDLVAVRSGQPGATAVVDQRFDGANCIDLIIIRRSHCINSEFLAHFLNSDPAKMQFLSGSGGAIQQHFNIETATRLALPLPPLEEQRDIAASISEATAKVDALSTATERTIALLRERRSALIAAAVTGHIDIGNMT